MHLTLFTLFTFFTLTLSHRKQILMSRSYTDVIVYSVIQFEQLRRLRLCKFMVPCAFGLSPLVPFAIQHYHSMEHCTDIFHRPQPTTTTTTTPAGAVAVADGVVDAAAVDTAMADMVVVDTAVADTAEVDTAVAGMAAYSVCVVVVFARIMGRQRRRHDAEGATMLL
ncbi:uncharacterized protein K452DRAFT_100800 [Aplosporella prunicola CBS 121167]|uniref:Uncharacterized protein n=1 Tax=Aplosporella prunicola CBS 121167 TaxID=1176127 RepID=A0A6A6B267_9PEZI|nr:uncharacterized protein K452DRAFT_100800 [Aplosporella prunicola CBS 121167]KAF2137678.1 hypothetical protein K452DRAFT_100800 [Aplosporella prunicola CBS 121167]